MASQPWSAPDARADEPVPVRPPVTDADELPAVDVPRPIPLRPMTAADVLDGGIAVIKAAPRTVVVVVASILVPIELLSAWVHRDTLADRGFLGALSAATSSSSSSSQITWATVLLFVLAGLALSIVTGAMAHLVCAWFADRVPPASEALTASLRRTPALLLAWFAVHVVEAVAFVAGFVPIVFVAPIFMVVAPVIVVERLGPA